MPSPSEALKQLRTGQDDGRKALLAWEIWQTKELALPRKNEVLLEFVLDRLLKGRNETGPTASLPNELYWSLIAELVDYSSEPLPALLSRIPTLPVLSALFAHGSLEPQAIFAANAAFERLLPYAARRAKVDDVLDCLHAGFASLSDHTLVKSELIQLYLRHAEGALQAGGPNARKKAYTAFLQADLVHLLDYLALETSSSTLSSALLATAGSTLFSQPILSKSVLPDDLVSALSALVDAAPARTRALPDLLNIYIAALRRHAHVIFPYKPHAQQGESSRSALELHHLAKTRAAAFQLLDQLLLSLQKHPDAESLLKLVELLRKEGLYSTGAVTGGLSTLQKCCSLAIASWSAASLRTISHLVALDFQSVLPQLADVLQKLASQPSDDHTEAQSLLAALTGYYAQIRQLPAYLDLLCDALTSANDLATAFASPLTDTTALQAELRASLNPAQAVSTLEALFARFTTATEGGEASAEGPKKKRRKLDASNGQRRLATAFIACIALDAIVVPKGDRDAFAKLLERVKEHDALQGALTRVLVKGKLGEGEQYGCIAALRLLQSIARRQKEDLTSKSGLLGENVPDALKALSGELTGLKPELTLELYRSLFASLADLGESDREVFFSCLLGALGRAGVEVWNGHIHGMADEALHVALWHLFSLNAGLFERYASTSQFEAFARLLLALPPIAAPPSLFSAAHSRHRMLLSAAFYEYKRIRETLLNTIMSERSPSSDVWSTLATFPMQYFPLSHRKTLAQKALAFDKLATDAASQVAARSFIHAAAVSGAHVATSDSLPDLLRLTDDADANEQEVSIKLLSALVQQTLARCKMTSDYEPLLSLVAQLRPLKDPLSLPSRCLVTLAQALSKATGLNERCATVPAYVSKRHYIAHSLPDETKGRLRASVEAACAQVTKAFGKSKKVQFADDAVTAARCRLVAALIGLCEWTDSFGGTVDSLYSWANQQLRSTATYDTALTSEGTTLDTLASLELFSALLRSSPSVEAYEAFVALAVARIEQQGSLAPDEVLTILASAFRSAPVDAYAAALALLESSIISSVASEARQHACFTALRTLLENGPDASSDFAGASLSRALRMALSSCLAGNNGEQLQAVLALASIAANEKASLLDASDAGCLIALLASLHRLSPASRGAIATASIRLLTRRTDLVRSLLPSFCRLVAQLLCACSPLNTPDPADEAVGRLLHAMGSNKTLTGGLSKHAPFILLPWLRAGAPGRASLGTKTGGLHALLSTLGDHEKDSLLGGYLGKEEEAERVLFKGMIKEYERTRYKGEA